MRSSVVGRRRDPAIVYGIGRRTTGRQLVDGCRALLRRCGWNVHPLFEEQAIDENVSPRRV